MKLGKKNLGRMVYIEWEDAHSLTNEWTMPNEYGIGYVVRTVGILTRVTKRNVVITSTIAPGGYATASISIPKRGILKVKPLRT